MRKQDSSKTEFICLMAVFMSITALAIDAVLPALDLIGTSLGAKDANDSQLVIITLFVGMAIGLLLYGPLSDSYGRKRAIYLGMAIFVAGSGVSLAAMNFSVMLAGRLLQGFGIASCRVVSIAMIRDRFEGREMGRVMSLTMVLLIMVPAIAPSIGQLILSAAGWRSIFGMLLTVGICSCLWLYLRQQETLTVENRLAFSVKTIGAGVMETARNRTSLAYMLASGIVFGGFVGYLSSAQQILQIQYRLGNSFSIYFGGLALAIGIASYVNSRLVIKYGMETLCFAALLVLSTISLVFFLVIFTFQHQPALTLLMGFLAVIFFCFGILFSSFSTLAVQPLGHIAGIANSVISFVQTLMSVTVGGAIGQGYNGTVSPLVLGFFLCGLSSLLIMIYIRKYIARNSF